jgi:hypothetical protein
LPHLDFVIAAEENELQIRVDGDPPKTCLIYLPGVHGDWTLLTSFRELAEKEFFLVQVTYPRTLTWTLEDYATAIDQALARHEIKVGWVLAESFSSQVAWAWLKLAQQNRSSFQFSGIILAGGFVLYPFIPLVRAAGHFFELTPWRLWKMLFWIYIQYSYFRHRHVPASAQTVHEFIARRTKLDIAAMRHRLKLMAEYDPRTVAAQAPCPVYLLAGADRSHVARPTLPSKELPHLQSAPDYLARRPQRPRHRTR